MSDLISRSALLKAFMEATSYGCGSVGIKFVDDLIKNQPTAYDVEKVVEQLETKLLGKVCIGCGYLKDNICTYKGSNCGVSKPMYDDIKKVFAEVRTGGKE